MLVVSVLLIVSVLLFSWLVQRVSDLQITNVLQLVGNKGREVIREMFDRLDHRPATEWQGRIESADDAVIGPVIRTVTYSGEPRTITRFNIDSLVRQAQQADAIIVMACAVGDTIVEDATVLRLHGMKDRISEKELMRAIHLDQ